MPLDTLPTAEEDPRYRNLEKYLIDRTPEIEQFDSPPGLAAIIEDGCHPLIAETLLQQLDSELYFEHHFDDDFTQIVWSLPDTYESVIIEMNLEDGQLDRSYYALTSKAEACDDLRWWAHLANISRSEFTISAMKSQDEIMADVLSNTRTMWRPIVKEWLTEALDIN